MAVFLGMGSNRGDRRANLGRAITLMGERGFRVTRVSPVVESPALDIAVSFFQADSYMMLAAAGSFLGTLDDAQRYFGVNTVTMFMMNVDLPSSRRPPEFKADEPPDTADKILAASMMDWQRRLPNQRDVLAQVLPRLTAFVEGETAAVDHEVRQFANLQGAQVIGETERLRGDRRCGTQGLD